MMKTVQSHLLSAFACVALSSACSTVDRETQITVGLSSETLIPSELNRLSITIITPDGQKRFIEYDDGSGTLSNTLFPGTAAVIPATERSLEGPLTIELRGYQGQTEILKRRSRLSYVRGRNITIPMPLRMACFNQACKADETCKGGTCMPDFVEAEKLRDYAESEVLGDLGVACFDEVKCLETSKPVDVTVRPVEGAYECTFAVPSENANVSIRWQAAEGRVIVLDEGDALEGWTRVSPTMGKLAPGLCTSYADPHPFGDPARVVYDRALDVAVSTTCATKGSTLPFCLPVDGDKRVAGSGAQWKNAPKPDYSPRPVLP